MAHVYHWKHGWIPLTHEAALSKAKGNHQAAAKMLADAPHASGIRSRQDVAKAVQDLPNVPAHERGSALTQLHDAAIHHDSADLVPPVRRSQTNWGWERLPNTAGGAQTMPTREVAKHAFPWVRDKSLFDKSNPHQHDAMMGLLDSMQAEGIKTPIVLNHDHETGVTQVIDGNHRLAAALALGVKHVPVAWWGEPPPKRRKAGKA